MRIKIDGFEDDPDGKTLCFGEDERGNPVSFHLPTNVANLMRSQVAAGNTVEAVIPDEVSLPN